MRAIGLDSALGGGQATCLLRKIPERSKRQAGQWGNNPQLDLGKAATAVANCGPLEVLGALSGPQFPWL